MTPAARNEPPVTLRRLVPEPASLTADELVTELRPWELAPAGRPHVAVNMVHTTDGRAAVDGRTAPISSVADRQLFHALRTRVDAILVGAGTLRVERYGRIVKSEELREKRRAEGLDPDPLAVIVSARLDLPADLPLLNEPEQRVVIATGSDATLPDLAAQVEYLRVGDDLPVLMARLREEHGVRSVLCEGGPTLNFHLLAAGLVDELFLCTSPKLVGGAGLTIVSGRELLDPAEAELVWLHEGGRDLFSRWRLRPA